jgi:glycosyltransferase involved in cell wall biosynthesis
VKKISFCINTAVNEINHVKLLFRSLEKNLSSKEHEIIVFIDSDNQGTFEWLLTQKETFPNLKILKNNLPICYGYSRNINEMFEQASNDIVSYLQSDMVICKDYDIEVLNGLEPGMMVCSTRVEPPLHPEGPEKITKDFGLDPLKFDLELWTNFAEQHKEDKWSVYFFAPFTMYKKEWLSVGGHNTIFRRSREDSDMLIRMVLNGTKIVQTWRALAYHFTCTSSRGLNWFNKQNVESQQRLKVQQEADRWELCRFTILWGAFSHGTLTPEGFGEQYYYNIAANIKNVKDINKFYNFEMFFNEVYVDNEEIITNMQNIYNHQHKAANHLLNITDEVWEEYKYMYNKLKASDRIKPLSNLNKNEKDIIIEFDLETVDYQYINSFLVHLQQIINETEELGEFEYGPFKFTINNKIDRSDLKKIITNPKIKKEHLYTIH